LRFWDLHTQKLLVKCRWKWLLSENSPLSLVYFSLTFIFHFSRILRCHLYYGYRCKSPVPSQNVDFEDWKSESGKTSNTYRANLSASGLQLSTKWWVKNLKSQTCLQLPPSEPKNSGRCWQVVIIQTLLYIIKI